MYVVLAISLMISLSRWGCLATLTVKYINSINSTQPGENALLDSHLLVIGNLIAQSCRVLQFAALIYGVWKSSQVLRSPSGLKKLRKTRAKFFLFERDHNSCTVHTFILVGILLLYCVITWLPPVLLTTWIKEFSLWHDDDKDQQRSSLGYTVLAWFHHISDLVIRVAMGVSTRMIMVAWSSGEEKLKTIEKSEDPRPIKFSRIVQNYEKIGKIAAALQDIFQEWFVMSWVVYFIGVIGNIVLVLKALFQGFFSTNSHRSLFYFAHLVSDFASLLIPYICGGLMNHYHKKFRDALKEVQEKILSNSDVLTECIQQRAVLIQKNASYKFVPSLCCINIPLESAGFSFTLILTGFGFVLSFILAFTNI